MYTYIHTYASGVCVCRCVCMLFVPSCFVCVCVFVFPVLICVTHDYYYFDLCCCLLWRTHGNCLFVCVRDCVKHPDTWFISLLITHNYQYNEHCKSYEHSYISSKANQMSKYFSCLICVHTLEAAGCLACVVHWSWCMEEARCVNLILLRIQQCTLYTYTRRKHSVVS